MLYQLSYIGECAILQNFDKIICDGILCQKFLQKKHLSRTGIVTPGETQREEPLVLLHADGRNYRFWPVGRKDVSQPALFLHRDNLIYQTIGLCFFRRHEEVAIGIFLDFRQ